METPALSGLARRIVQEGILTAETASKASQQATQDKIPFITHLVQRKLADAKSLAMVCADEFGYPYFDLSALDKEAQPKELVSEKLVRQHNVMPLFKRGSRLYLAISDPTNQQALSDVQFHTGLMTDAVKFTDDATRKGSIPMLSSRFTVDGASLVWRVERTIWPVSAALTAISAVSKSRISPTMMMSGS